jgi:hypothetical protein
MLDAIQKLLPWVATLTTGPKVLLSLAVVCVAGFSLAVIWTTPLSLPTSTPSPLQEWPTEKSLDALKRKLDRISKDNAMIIELVADSGKYGIYVDELATKTKKSRDEVVYRLKNIETDGLIEVEALTDLNARLNEDVIKVLGPNAADFLKSYLK